MVNLEVKITDLFSGNKLISELNRTPFLDDLSIKKGELVLIGG